MNYEDIELKTIDNLGLKNGVTMQSLIDMNVKAFNEYYEEIKDAADLNKNLTVFRNLLLKELVFTLAIRPVQADEIMAAVDDKTDNLYEIEET